MTKTPANLAIKCPHDLQLRAICIDGKLSQASLRESDEFTVSLDGVPKTHAIAIAWWTGPADPLPQFGVADISIPRLQNIQAETTLCAIVPLEGRTLLTKSGATHIDAITASILRLEALVGMMWEGAEADPVQLALWKDVIQTRNSCVEQMKSLRASGGRASIASELNDRFQRAQDEVQRLQGFFSGSTNANRAENPSLDSGEKLGIPSPMMPGNPNLMDSELTETSTGEMSFLVVSDRWIVVALSGLGLLVVPAFLYKVVPANAMAWLARWPAVKWATAGLLWWSCLAFSAGGLVLLVVAVFVGLSRRRLAAALPSR